MISESSQQSFLGMAGRTAAALCVLVAVGCKAGNSWTAKPSWWTFGNDDPAKLATAPPASADIPKPSSTAKRYPTTSTPEGYVLEDAQRNAAASSVASSTVETSSPTPPAAVTYGSKPAPPPAFASAPPAAGQSPTQPSSLSSISPQVGPYAAPPAAAPAADQPLPTAAASFAAAPPPAEPPMAAVPPAAPIDSRFGAAGARVADARGSESWPQPPATVPAASDSRYPTSGGSRFSTPPSNFETTPAGAFPPPAADATPAAMLAPPSFPAAGTTTASPPAAAVPGANALPAAAALPPAAGGQLPASQPAHGSLPAAAPTMPTRRPDPGYRPGGTSSYRPSRTILTGGDDAAAGSVTPVAFETPSSP